MKISETRSAQLPSGEVFTRLISHVRHGTCDMADDVLVVEPQCFTDPDIARRERELLFGRVPFVVAHTSELDGPGSFRRLRLPNNEALLVRQDDGSLRTLVNVCRHRGNLVEGRAAGTCRTFTCAYHAWSYGRDGSLRNITFDHTFGDVDPHQASLVCLPTVERYGLIWVVDDPRAELDLDAWLGEEMATSLAGLQLDEFICARSDGFDEPVNWKVMQDAFLDGYHIQFVHPKSAGPHFYTNRQVCEILGRHVRFFAARRSIDRYLDDCLDDVAPVDHVTMSHYIAPNVTLLRQPDHYEILSFFPHPSDPTSCRMEMRLIVPPVESTDLTEAEWTTTWDRNWDILIEVLNGEDFPLLRNTQRALASSGAGPLVYGRNEIPNQAFHHLVKAAAAL